MSHRLLLYTKSYEGSYIILLLCVDDMLITGVDKLKIEVFKRRLSNEFEMKDLGVTD